MLRVENSFFFNEPFPIIHNILVEKKIFQIFKIFKVKLNNGLLMPLIGYGTWKVVGDEDIFKVIDAALAANYRHIDTAVAYNNHRSNTYRRQISKLPKPSIFLNDILTSQSP